MVQFQQIRNGPEALLEIGDLLERIAEFDDGGLVEHAVSVHDELAVLKAVEVGGDEEEIRAGFDLEVMIPAVRSLDQYQRMM